MTVGMNYHPDTGSAQVNTQTEAVAFTPKGVKLDANSGVKFDTDKLGWHLLPPDALDAIVDVLDFGANKYGDRNWEKGMDWSRPFSACMRHLWAYWRRKDYDKETGMLHLAHAACCILFMLSYQIRGIGVDNRPTGVAGDDD